MRNLKLTVQYIGTHYLGWQVQPQGPTIQSQLQEALGEILREEVTVLSSSRTDSGVHALAQVAHFKTDHGMDPLTLEKALNSKLPGDISVLSVEEMPEGFHSQRQAKFKTYSYFILNSVSRISLFYPFTWRLYGYLDLDEMHRCLELLVGEHDFNAFKAADSCAKTSVRRLQAVNVQRLPLADLGNSLLSLAGLTGMVHPLGSGDEMHEEEEGAALIAISFKGQGFLKHMVRNIVGTVVEVGMGKRSFADFQKIFESRDRTQAGKTAPPQGLFLVKVEY